MSKYWNRAMAAGVLTLASFAASAATAIQAFDAGGMDRIVAEQKGKPFVLVVWALDCAYCEPSFKTLAQEKKKRKFNVVTLTTDPAADPQAMAAVRKKLEATGLKDNAWAFGDAAPERLRYAIDPKWYGEMPRSYWFDASGKRVAQYSGVITTETVAKLAPR